MNKITPVMYEDASEVAKYWDKPIDVLFIDGNHDYEFVKADWGNWSPFVKDGGYIFFHDCEPDTGVYKVYESIKQEKGLSRDSLDDRNTSVAWVRK